MVVLMSIRVIFSSVGFNSGPPLNGMAREANSADDVTWITKAHKDIILIDLIEWDDCEAYT